MGAFSYMVFTQKPVPDLILFLVLKMNFKLKSDFFVTNSRKYTYKQIEAFIDDTLKVKKSTNNNLKDEEFI